MLEAITQGCLEGSNVYDVYDASNDQLLFVAVERSEDFLRCCMSEEPH